MNYLLDTCAISEIIRPNPNKSFIQWLDSQNENNMFLSLLTLGELYKGTFKLKNQDRQKSLLTWIEHNLKLRFHGRIISLDESIIFQWGKVNGESEQNGIKLPIMDSLISAIAITNNLIVVTRNEKDFEKCLAKTINPWN